MLRSSIWIGTLSEWFAPKNPGAPLFGAFADPTGPAKSGHVRIHGTRPAKRLPPVRRLFDASAA